MDYKEYQDLSEKTFAYFKDRRLEDKSVDILHCVVGASTEAGELLDALKKHIWYQKPIDVVNVGEEIADIMWYLSNLCRLLNLDMEKLLENNINKLKARYGDKFSEDKALNRDLEAEREILEKILPLENFDETTSERLISNNNGLRPPKPEYEVDFFEKHKVLSLLKEKRLSKPNALIDMETFVSSFEFLELDGTDYKGPFIVNLLKSSDSIKKVEQEFLIDLSKTLKKICLGECILLKIYDVTYSSKFIIEINFNKNLGELSYEKMFSLHEEVSSLTNNLLIDFLDSKKIKHNLS